MFGILPIPMFFRFGVLPSPMRLEFDLPSLLTLGVPDAGGDRLICSIPPLGVFLSITLAPPILSLFFMILLLDSVCPSKGSANDTGFSGKFLLDKGLIGLNVVASQRALIEGGVCFSMPKPSGIGP